MKTVFQIKTEAVVYCLKSRIGWFAAVILFFSIVSMPAAKIWFVDSALTGLGGTHDGTSWTAAWTNLTKITGISPGDTVQISGGPSGSSQVYQLSSTWTPTSGNAANQITYEIGQDSSHNGTAIFNVSGYLIQWTAKYYTFSGNATNDNLLHFVVNNPGFSLIQDNEVLDHVHIAYLAETNSTYFLGDQSSPGGNEIDHCLYYKLPASDDGILSLFSSNEVFDAGFKIHDNIFYAPHAVPESNLGDDFINTQGASISGMTLYNNKFISYGTSSYTANQHQDGSQILGGDYIKIYNNYYQDIVNYPVYGDAFRAGFNHFYVYNNIIVFVTTGVRNDSAPQAIAIGSEMSNAPFNDIVVANNLVADYGGGNHHAVSLGNGGSGTIAFGTNLVVANNLALNNSASPIYNVTPPVNFMTNANVNLNISTGSGFFVSYIQNQASNADFHLTSPDTKLIGKGTNLTSVWFANTPPNDRDGLPRLTVGNWDIGPYLFPAVRTIATSWFVDGNAKGTDDGTSWANAWTNLNQITNLIAGDTVYISGGASNSSQVYQVPNGWSPYGGSAASPIVYQISQDAQDTQHDGTAIFDCNGGTWINVDATNNFIVNGSANDGNMHFALTNCGTAIQAPDSTNVAISYINMGSVTGLDAIEIPNTSGINIGHCSAILSGANANYFCQAGNLKNTAFGQSSIHDCTIYLPRNNSDTVNPNGARGIDISGNGLDVSNNVFVGYATDNYSASQQQYGVLLDDGSFFVRVVNNTFVDMAGYAVLGRIVNSAGNIYVANNICALTDPALIDYETHDSATFGAIVINSQGGQGPLPPTALANIAVANNIAVDYTNSVTFGLYKLTGSNVYTGCIVANNINLGGGNSTNDSPVTTNNEVNVANVAQAAADFVSYTPFSGTNNNLHPLLSAASIVNIGTNLSTYITTDKDGDLRPSAPTNWNVGPYQTISNKEPVISNVQFFPNANTATITWTTDEGADSIVNYGLTTNYDLSATNNESVTSHSVTISNLTLGAAYHFQVASIAGLDVNVSTDYSFVALAALTVSADNQVRGYGQSNPTLTGTVSANGDGITANFTTTADTNSPMGTYPITIILNDPLGKLGNYVVTTTNGTLTVTNALLTIAANNANKVYGQTLTFAGTEFMASGLVNTDSVSGASLNSAGAGAGAGAGTYAINVSNAQGNSRLTNYLITYVPGTLTVNQSTLTVSADNQVRGYGQDNPALTGTMSANGDSITANFTTAADVNSPVGNYLITPVLNDPNGKLGNYAVTTTNGILTVTNALLTVTANDANKVVGQTLTFAGTEFTASGLVSTDSVSSATLSSAGANAAAAVDTYPININNAVGDDGLTNYLIMYMPGTLTVNPVGSPQISPISQSPSDVDPMTTGVQVYQGMTVQYSASLLDSGGDTVFWEWGYAADDGPTNFVLNGTNAITDVSFTYTNGAAGSNYLWVLVASNSTASVTSSLAVDVEPAPPSAQPITFSAKSGVVSSPLMVTNGIIGGVFDDYIYQPVQTTSVGGAGSATYNFNITNAGNYVVQALVEPSSESANSFFFNIDAQPADPTNIWDVYPVNTNFEEVFVSWRGTNADPSNPQFNPVVFNLDAGKHQLFLYGREADADLANFSLMQVLVNPVVPPVKDQTVALGQTLSFTVSATDTNPPPQNALNFSLAAGAPAGASINSTNGFFNWTATNALGTNVISVIVTDGAGMSAVQMFKASVVSSPQLNASLSPDGSQFALSWLPSETNYLVYTVTNLASSWNPVASTLQSNSGTLYLTVTTTNRGQQFYRLQSQ